MEEIESILLSHFKKYPCMKVEDAVKLIYQNEFGPGHLIKDFSSCQERIEEEYQSNKDERKEIIKEDIGNGYYRYYLYKLDITTDELATLFFNSSNNQGSIESFKSKLETLKELAKNKKTPFSFNELNSYLINYEKEGYPMVSHSKIYKDLYHPSYRVIKKLTQSS